MREDGLHGEGDLMNHGLDHERLDALLGDPHPALVPVPELRRPTREASLYVWLGQDRHHHAIGVDQRDADLRCQSLVQERRLARSVVPGEDDGERFAGSGLRGKDLIHRLPERRRQTSESLELAVDQDPALASAVEHADEAIGMVRVGVVEGHPPRNVQLDAWR